MDGVRNLSRRSLLRAAAVYATGGLKALAKSGAAPLLIEQLK